MKYVPPSVSETAFNCPHCGAFAHQTWWSAFAEKLTGKNTPQKIMADDDDPFETVSQNDPSILDGHWTNLLGQNFDKHPPNYTTNIWFSECFNCEKVSVWIYDRLVFPVTGSAPPPNPDLSTDIRRDYKEASAILDISPRGAAALIRLAIQKLCKELGQPGKNINQDIAALVKDGLAPRIQKALDTVRVIGNEAVHPGQIDLRDDRATAETLFRLLNLVAEKMISEPKHVDEVYNSLPEEKRAAIEKRDGKK